MKAWNAAIVGLVLCSGGGTAAADAELLWSVDVPADPSVTGTTFWIPDAALLDDGRAVLLGLEGQKVSLMIASGPAELGDWVDLPMPGTLTRLEVDEDLGIWIGGYSRGGQDNGRIYRDLALVHLDLDGNILWAAAFGEPDEYFSIEDMAVLPSGDIVVSGNFFQNETFIARISASGEMLWQDTFGVGKGSDVALLSDGNLMVVAFAATENRAAGLPYAEDAVAWIFSAEGQELSHSVVRAELNREQTSRFGEVSLVAAGEDVYATTEWTWPDASPVALSRLSPSGEVLSEATLRKPRADTGGPLCNADIAVGESSLFIACGNEGAIDIYALDRDGGTPFLTSAALPECNGVSSARVLIAPAEDGNFLILGRRPGYNVHGGCAWLARVTMD